MTEKTANETLEKGFNDDELADIMSEIESLEKEFVDETPVMKAPEEKVEVSEETIVNELREEIQNELRVDAEDVQAKKTDLQAEIDNELESMIASHKPVETPVIQEVKELVKEEPVNNVVSLKEVRAETTPVKTTPKTENQTQLDFSVAGQMNLKLNFTVGGQTIGLTVNETEGMVIEMMGGARFILPMADITAKKKAA